MGKLDGKVVIVTGADVTKSFRIGFSRLNNDSRFFVGLAGAAEGRSDLVAGSALAALDRRLDGLGGLEHFRGCETVR